MIWGEWMCRATERNARAKSAPEAMANPDSNCICTVRRMQFKRCSLIEYGLREGRWIADRVGVGSR
jgi:hypothetical protein